MEKEEEFGFSFVDEDAIPGLTLAEPDQDEFEEAEEIELPGLEVAEPETKTEEETTEEESEEEETTEEKTEETEEKEPEASADGELKIKFSDFYSVLKDHDLVDLAEGEEVTEENLIKGLTEASKKNAANQIYDLVTKVQGAEGWKLFEDVFIKGASKDYLATHYEQEELATLDLEDPIIQEDLYRQYLKETSQMADEDIDDQIEFYKTKNTLGAKAESARTELIKTRDKQKELASAQAEERTNKVKQAEQAYVTSLSDTLTEVSKEKEIDGVPITPEDSRVLVGYVTSKKYELNNGQKISEFEKDLLELRKDPKTALKLAKLVKDKLSVKQIEKAGVSKKATFLFKEIESEVKKEPKEKAEQIELSRILKMLD